MKNILVCAVNYHMSSDGAYHFSQHILDLNNVSNIYRIWLLTEDASKNDVQRNEKSNIYVIKVPFNYPSFLFPFFHFFRNWAYYRAIRRFQIEKNIDAVLFSQAFLGVLTRLFLPQKIKIAGIIHDAMSLAPNKKTHYSRKSFWLHQLTQRPLEILANYILDFTVGNSKFIQKLILEKRRLAVDRVPMIYQSIDVSKIQFQPIEWQYKQGESLKILFVKSGFVGGGLEDLITALGSLSYHFHLAVIGPNPSVQPIIKNWAKNFSNISLHCMGLLMQSEVLSAMSSHHILCIPSRHEAFGLANVEGLANGISVVSTKIGGIPEVLDNGRCGWLAESNNPHSLSLVLKACIESPPSVRLEKSNYGRQHVEKLFSKKEMLEEFINLFEEMTV